MNFLNFILLITSVFLLSIGQVLFKLASASFPVNFSTETFLPFLINKYFLTALCLYGTATFLWVWVLNTTPLSIAYPFMALAFVIVPFLSYLLLDEQLSRPLLIGSGFIIVGLIIAVR